MRYPEKTEISNSAPKAEMGRSNRIACLRRTSSILLPEEPTPREASQAQQSRAKQHNRGRFRHGRSPSEIH